jgi:LPXTG-motif cell wall-anchored protein
MRFKSGLLMLFLLVFSAGAYAQDTSPSAAETAENLKAHLLDVQGKEETLRARLAELDEAIKPENIERSLAGVGSTRPEELRESRRRQLTIQRDGLRAQLQTLETERQRLEAALANAEALAYQQSARPTTQMMSARSPRQYQWLMLGGGALAALALGGGALFYRRKRRK